MRHIIVFTIFFFLTFAFSCAKPIPTLSVRGLELEGKILKGEELKESDIGGLSKQELGILWNMHWAKYGKEFDDENGAYYRSRPWFKAGEFDVGSFSGTDFNNVGLLSNAYEGKTSQANQEIAEKRDSPSKQSNSSSSSSSSSSPASELTTQNAQDALNRFASANGFGTMRLRGGIQEKPATNSAVADIDVGDFRQGNVDYNRAAGKVGFVHYNDGRWVLKEVYIKAFMGNTPNYWTPTFQTSIEVRE